MPRGKALPDDKRQAILDDIKASQKSRNAIARDHDVSVGTVTNIAKRNGLTTAFDRSSTKRATEAKQADNRAVRAELSRRLLAKAGDLLDQMDGEYLVYSFGGKDNTFNSKVLPKPPAAELRNLMTSAAVAIDKHVVIDRHDSGAGAEQAVSLLGALLDGMQERHGTAPK
ncbi:hypothetical protein [Planomonospora venezuelensis]|uniref:Transposase-like protein n=1 Tax=Planomonospora venezuelensis TaxID=1999 RepID=A0A841DCI4_PLAVE|nr:hypothetical protein [Planomonospora venezuelensis]MBB5965066.1 transposase-like protein [Planomonospora venezuelensis]GIN05017.1 hypothetical protein Pve01_66750 [Planomonospora venezuelensis]